VGCPRPIQCSGSRTDDAGHGASALGIPISLQARAKVPVAFTDLHDAALGGGAEFILEAGQQISMSGSIGTRRISLFFVAVTGSPRTMISLRSNPRPPMSPTRLLNESAFPRRPEIQPNLAVRSPHPPLGLRMFSTSPLKCDGSGNCKSFCFTLPASIRRRDFQNCSAVRLVRFQSRINDLPERANGVVEIVAGNFIIELRRPFLAGLAVISSSRRSQSSGQEVWIFPGTTAGIPCCGV
jgi:hypothetical protein